MAITETGEILGADGYEGNVQPMEEVEQRQQWQSSLSPDRLEALRIARLEEEERLAELRRYQQGLGDYVRGARTTAAAIYWASQQH